MGELLRRWRPGGRGGSWKPFLAHLGTRPERHRAIALRAERRVPRELSSVETKTLIDACDRLRDRFLLSLLRETGLRVVEALGLRHEDGDARRKLVAFRQRVNVNHARAKTWNREVPADAGLIRLYADYLHEEYGALDGDYVFVNLLRPPVGEPMSYAGVHRLVGGLRARTGISFASINSGTATPPICGVAASRRRSMQKLLGHASTSTTIDTYSHLDIEDARRALVTAGVLADASPESVP